MGEELVDFNSLQKLQENFDRRHGFPTVESSLEQKYLQISKDLVGLLGEIGEFANIVKKINLRLDRPEVGEFSISDFEDSLQEELIDSLVYILRLATILRFDVEAEYIKKMDLNESKYRNYK